MKKDQKQKGFTLIEIMVSVSIFIVVAFVVSSVFLTTNAATKKAQAIKIAMDNLNFALDSMVFKIREGTNYERIASEVFSFTSVDGDLYVFSLGRENDKGRIELTKNSGFPVSITSNEVDIINLEFVITEDSDLSRKQVTILITGVAGNSLSETSLFRVQTTVAQRNAS